jgi:GDP-L-fucose synthase
VRTEIAQEARIFVAGPAGLVGSAIVRRLHGAGFSNLLTATRQQLDLRDQSEVNHWFKANAPDYVFLVAGTVGGILANSTRPAEFIYDNLMIHGTVVDASHRYGVRKLLYLGSSCIYPRQATQPITEEQLLTGPLEPTNERYAIAKIAGIKLCQAYRRQYGCGFISAMPDQLVRTQRQLRPGERPRASVIDPEVPRCQEIEGRGRPDLGHGKPDA